MSAKGAVPVGLAKRGRALWLALKPRVESDPGAAVLLEEACRVADRLVTLDRILRGEEREFLRVVMDDDGEYRFYVDAALAEARRQATVLRQLLAALPAKEPDDDDADAWLAGLSAPVGDSEN